jgi:hypothetical protein
MIYDVAPETVTACTEETVLLRHLYRSPGHNFRGYHGRPPGTHRIVESEMLRCVAGQGIEGDRYFGLQPDFKGQITFLDWVVYQSLCEAVRVDSVPPSALRRNVVVEGVDLNRLIGRDFELQGIRFYGTEECRPCYWMDHAVAPGAEAFLKGRGGLRARILTSGFLRTGPAICTVSTN